MDDATRAVRLIDLPVQLWDRARQHADAMVREFAFLTDDSGEVGKLAQQLMDVAQASETQYAHLNPEAEDLVEAALKRGDDHITVDVTVPVAFKQHILDAAPVLIQVDEYCRKGALLTLATPDDLRGYWLWYLAEFVRQIDGNPPMPWPG